jgi:hypothetical protein
VLGIGATKRLFQGADRIKSAERGEKHGHTADQ